MKSRFIIYIFLLFINVNIKAQENDIFETVASLESGPGNIAVSKSGRIFLTMHQAFNPKIKIVELDSTGTLKPFPNLKWNKKPNKNGLGTNSPLGIQIDKNDILWTIDNGTYSPKIIAWDINSLEIHKVIALSHPVVGEKSFVNDLAIDLKNNAIYLADMQGDKGPAIIVVDIKTGMSRRVLEGHNSTLPSKDAIIKIEDNLSISKNNRNILNGLNPITIDPKNRWVYFGAMNGTMLYRIQTNYLIDDTLEDIELAKQVEVYGEKAVSDGITIDDESNVYVTDLNKKGIGVTYPNGRYEVFFSDDKLIWPDSLSTGPEGYIYGVVNQLNRSALLNGGSNQSRPPYLVIRFKALSTVTTGR